MKKFKRFYIEITNICNLSCHFCPPTGRKPDYISVSDFENILVKIRDYTDYLYFHVKGEPLLHPEIDKLLALSNQYGYKVNITTNGTRLMDMKETLWAQPALRLISISLQCMEDMDSPTRKNYLSEVLQFAKETVAKTPILIELRLWNLNGSSSDEKRQNDEALSWIEKELSLKEPLQEVVAKAKGVKISEQIYLSQSNLFQWPSLTNSNRTTEGFCYGLRTQIAVLVDGTVVPCCLDSEGDIALGNLFRQSMEEVINSDRAQKIYDGFSRKYAVEPLCQSCGYRSRFNTMD